MKRTRIDALINGQENCVCGFVENIRDKKSMAFLVVRDISGKLQVTIEKEKLQEVAAIVPKLTIDSVIKVTGQVVESSFVKMGGREMLPTSIEILSTADALPIDEASAIDSRMDFRWIDLRTEKNQLIFKVQTAMVKAMREFLLERDFLEIHSPKLIGAASETGSDVFMLDYFDRKAYLSQSPQFYKQMAMASGFERIFEVGPVFRAEKSYTSKHATEFTGFDLELSYIESYDELMQFEEEWLCYVLGKIKNEYGDEIKRLFDVELVVPSLPFPRIALKDLYAGLKTKYNFEVESSEMGDLTTDAERLSQRFALEEYNHEFLFVTDFDASKRAFYHMRDEKGVPLGYDLIWRGVEITTGAQREHRYESLKSQADEKGLGEDVKFYLEFFKYGCPPHGGFGVGIDRMTMLIFGIPIKEAMYIFRGPNRLAP